MAEREAILDSLARGAVFDLLVIGGGATGCGIALDAASRGLKVALAEKADFGSGTSGRSTKLLHGGVRYLERALLHLDRVNFNLVRDALHERGVLLRIAPHLCRRIPIIIPSYHTGELLYFLAGLKVYDLLSGPLAIGASRVVGAAEVAGRFPMLKKEGLKGGVLYYDGQFDDARMNLALALTALEHGAAVANYLEVVELVREKGRVAGARVREQFSGRSWEIRARCVVNACGPSVDLVRRLDDPEAAPLLQPSIGSHIVLSGALTSEDTGLTVPRTSDGRVLFVLPWHGKTLVGTTERPAAAGEQPMVLEDEVRYLLQHLDRYFNLEPEQRKILAKWAGLRPLVLDASTFETAKLHRDHLIDCSESGLITITGGKWTTYRKMAQDTVESAVRLAGLTPLRGCWTDKIMLHGAERFRDDAEATIAGEHGLDQQCARHLHRSYGDRAGEVARLCKGDLAERVVAGHPYLKGELLYAVRHELAVGAADFLVRRTSLARLDTVAARMAAPVVLELMAQELGWDRERMIRERQELERELRGGDLGL